MEVTIYSVLTTDTVLGL